MRVRGRTDSPRFSIHDAVRINDVISSSDAGRVGIVLSVEVNRYSRTLDKYKVLIGATERTLWDIQLVPIAGAPALEESA